MRWDWDLIRRLLCAVWARRPFKRAKQSMLGLYGAIMSRGRLTKKELQSLDARLPDTVTFQREVLELSPILISINAPKDSRIPIAAVCFRDLAGTLCAVRHALHECLACGLWYRQHEYPPKEMGAIFMESYYLDDAALRLYSAGEHLANVIVCMLAIEDSHLDEYRRGTTSKQAAIGKYLRSEQPREKLTQAVSSLADSDEWVATITYRNKWVHEQPPTIEGLGIQYRRRRRWERSEDGRGWKLPFGGGDPAQYTIDDLKNIIFPATTQLLAASWACFNHYQTMSESHC